MYNYNTKTLYYIFEEKSMVKKTISLIFSIFLICSVFTTTALAYKPSTFTLTAEGALIANVDTDAIIYEKNADQKLYPASLTKIMTAVVVLDECADPENTIVTCSQDALNLLLGTDSSMFNLVGGEQFSALELLYILLVHSANDAANSLAEHFGGTIPGFVDKMNAKAKELGMTGSHFMNPHGLHDEDHYTTPRDMYILTKHALENETFKKIFGTVRHTVPATNMTPHTRILATTVFIQDPNTSLANTYYRPVDGGKTGYTDPAGRCLVTYAEEDGITYICVVMNCPVKNAAGVKVRYEFAETKQLYEWVFNEFEYREVYDTATPVGECPVDLSMDTDTVALALKAPVNAVVPKAAEMSSFKVEVELLNERAEAPIALGQELGTATIKYAGETLATVPVVAINAVDRSGMLAFVKGVTDFFGGSIFAIIILVILLLIVSFIVYIIIINRNRRKRRRNRRRVRIK